jgi:hypothetical protein
LVLLAHGKLAADTTAVLGGGDHPAVDRQTASDTKVLNFEVQLELPEGPSLADAGGNTAAANSFPSLSAFYRTQAR